MRYYYDKQYGNDLSSLLRQRVPYAEWLKRPLRPLKRALFDALQRPQYQGNAVLPTGYTAPAVPSDEAVRLAAAFTVADEFMAAYNAMHPTEFLFKQQTLTKALS